MSEMFVRIARVEDRETCRSMRALLSYMILIAVPDSASAQNFGQENVVSSDVDWAYSVHAADLDGDGDPDVLSASWFDGKIAWYENQGAGKFGAQVVITHDAAAATSVYASDLDLDGDLDVLSSSSGDQVVAWYENLGGGAFGTRAAIASNAGGVMSVRAGDLDGDGDQDVVVASDLPGGNIVWIENLGGGSFAGTRAIEVAGGCTSVHIVDLDDDGDLDVLGTFWSIAKVAWYENQGLGVFGPQNAIETSGSGRGIDAADLDGDGDPDVIAGGPGHQTMVSWFENLGGGSFGPEQVITRSADHVVSVDAVDFDGDGDLDVLSASFSDSKIAWYENQAAQSWVEKVVSKQRVGATGALAVDLDRDGDCDVVSVWANPDSRVGWFENVEGPYVFADFFQVNTLFAGVTHTLSGVSFSPGAVVRSACSFAGGGPTNSPFGALLLSHPIIELPQVISDPAGAWGLDVMVPVSAAGASVWIQALDVASGELSNGLVAVIV